MCLSLDKIPVRRPRTEKFVYKVYARKAGQNEERTYFSPYQGTRIDNVRKGMVIRSSRKNTTLTLKEAASQKVHEGLHSFSTLKAAIYEYEGRVGAAIFKCVGKPEHFVGKGIFDGDRSVVYTQLKVVEIVKKKPIPPEHYWSRYSQYIY